MTGGTRGRGRRPAAKRWLKDNEGGQKGRGGGEVSAGARVGVQQLRGDGGRSRTNEGHADMDTAGMTMFFFNFPRVLQPRTRDIIMYPQTAGASRFASADTMVHPIL